ncbi:dihydroxyacetone kinase subunit DhaL [Mesomycoplasma lagogenitalium]|uniref:Dihydroxyacetone kinase subunit DhaL n=1 Tax=Mesomycoplasma lagogenitalium TaxID=171286 RepID=A0ABY8LUT4_9BACT|nr:dihydroxyacetone kinase subunit DhaL [Mesomycoplasma lagogenitalium]WGI36989.1 dihydroxyacetone kinase subunit DhaL [Mesomycoplasma lagogenitalium]
MKITISELETIFQNIKKDLEKDEDYISQLDQQIGDGDHGFNIVRGFTEVLNINSNNLSISEYLMLVGRTLMAKVGGASGPLYGMSFINASTNLKNVTEFSFNELKILINSFVSTLQMLGKVNENEKTMFDVWKPLADFVNQFSLTEQNSLKLKEQLLEKIAILVEKTKDMQATKGRASYLKERSLGTIDPGSYSSKIILENIIKVLL